MAEMFGHIINEPYGRITLNIPKFQCGTCLELRPINRVKIWVTPVFTGQAFQALLTAPPACQALARHLASGWMKMASMPSCLVIPAGRFSREAGK